MTKPTRQSVTYIDNDGREITVTPDCGFRPAPAAAAEVGGPNAGEAAKYAARNLLRHGEEVRVATIERCAQVVQKYIDDLTDAKSETMSHWDQIRHQVETYKGSDLPRLNFESLIETIAENAAAAIRALKDKP